MAQKPILIALGGLALLGSVLPAWAQSGPGGGGRALRIEIIGDLDFGVAAQGTGAGGSIRIDPETGVRSLSGGLVSVSGSSFQGTARITGQPFSRVRIELPVSSNMNASKGGKAEIVDFTSTVPSSVMLGASGVLEFRFAGRFAITSGDEGDFRGRVQVTVNYE
jgi:hypothetical protein